MVATLAIHAGLCTAAIRGGVVPVLIAEVAGDCVDRWEGVADRFLEGAYPVVSAVPPLGRTATLCRRKNPPGSLNSSCDVLNATNGLAVRWRTPLASRNSRAKKD